MYVLPVVSIITINFNQTEVTRDLLLSLQGISFKSIEVIVVDNGSQDESIRSLQSEFPAVKIIQTGKNLGFAGGNNKGIHASTGKYLVFINNDVEVTPGFLEPLIDTFLAYPRCGLATPKIIFHNRDEIIQYAGSGSINVFTSRGNRTGYLEKDTGQHDSVHQTELGHGACLMASRDVVEKVGAMPELYFLYYEEHDWTEQAKKKGFDVYYVGTSKIYHKESVSTGKNSPLKTYYLSRNRILFVRRNSSTVASFIAFFYILIIAIPKNVLTLIATRNFANIKPYCRGAFHGLFYNLLWFKN